MYVHVKILQAVVKANTKRLKGKGLNVMDLNDFIVYLLPASRLSDESSSYMKKIAIV